jgi:hypothetical protein
MGPFGELLACGQRQTLEFFFVGLKEVSEPTVDHGELMYNASVLAHYAQVSRFADDALPTPNDLGEVFDHFVLDTSLRQDPEMMEMAGAQCLLLTGFFERQMRHRYNIRWYIEMGSGFFKRAAGRERTEGKARMLGTIGSRFEFWRERHARLSRELGGRSSLLIAVPPRKPRGSGRQG